jgi:DNA-binding Xre family transcriptional regulator
MAQAGELIDTLKRVLRSQGITYAVVAERLGMSEANVKRMFASRRFTLERVEDICRLMNMDLTDLLHYYDDSRQRINQLTLEQEEELIQDLKLLLVAVSVRNRLSFEDILSNYRISETECIHYLAKLDRLKIIDLLPHNRIKLRIDEGFRWRPNGPIERFYEEQIQGQFLKSTFSGKDEKRLFLFGLLSETSTEHLLSKIQSFANEFTELHRQDSHLPLDRRRTTGLMLAMRPWESDVFRPFLK